MATNAISLAWALSFNNGELQETWQEAGQSIDQTGTDLVDRTQDIPTTAAGTALVIPSEIATNGWGYVRNMDPTNYIELGVQVGGTFYPFCRVDKNESFPLRWAQGVTPYARANTSTVKLRYGVAEH